MAGLHQIWRMSLTERVIGPYAGNGIEDIVDGPLLPPVPFQKGYSSFAQPSGLASDGRWLFVADSEGSSIRAVPFRSSERVATLLGTAQLPDQRLFTFGDRDGPVGQALLQHPIGVAFHDGSVFVADTYNHKIKQITLANPPQIRSIVGGNAGSVLEISLNEPAGLSVAGNVLYVADTNNHRICTVALKEDFRAQPLSLVGLQPPSSSSGSVFGPLPSSKRLAFPTTSVRPIEGMVRVRVQLRLPKECEINAAAPMSYALQVAEHPGPLDPTATNTVRRVENPAESFEIAVPVTVQSGKTTVRLSVVFYYCRKGAEAVCMIGNVNWTGEIRVDILADDEVIELTHTVE
jgi:hypothetical protein